MEKAAGVTEEDKKDDTEDEKKQPALFRAYRHCGKAFARLSKANSVNEEDLLAKAEARFTKAIGTGKLQLNLGDANTAKTATAAWKAKVEEMKSAHGNNAASFAARAFPKEHQAYMKEVGATK
jgi:hypothetical protein